MITINMKPIKQVKPKAKRKPKAKKKSIIIKQVMWGIVDTTNSKLEKLHCSSVPELYASKIRAKDHLEYYYDGVTQLTREPIKLILTINK